MKEQSETPKHFFKQLMEEAIPWHKIPSALNCGNEKRIWKVRVPFREEVVGDIRRRAGMGHYCNSDGLGGRISWHLPDLFEDKNRYR